MKQEQKDLLIKDLCGRLPYGVKLETLEGPQKLDMKWLSINMCNIASPYLPYLFPMPKADEDEEYSKFLDELIEIELKLISGELKREQSFEFEMNYYHKNHIDYRGLIPKGLAIDCTNLNIY